VSGRVASSYYAARRFDEAAAALRQAAEVAPALVGPHEKLVHAYRHSSRPREALEEALRVLSMVGVSAPRDFLSPAGRQRSLAWFLGGTIEYLRHDAARTPGLFADRIAVLHAALGHRQEALRWLDVAARERSTTLPVTLTTDPDLDALRGDAGFRALLQKLRLS
jgi:hypothetical protein